MIAIFFLQRLFIRHMKKSEGVDSVVTLTSVHAKVAFGFNCFY